MGGVPDQRGGDGHGRIGAGATGGTLDLSDGNRWG
jgi:hypothetical protein